MTTHVLLLGRTPFDPEAVRADFSGFDVSFSTGTSLQEMEGAFESGPIDTVIVGAGIPLDDRLQLVRRVFELSESTTVHMKDRTSGKDGMMPFVKHVLEGLESDRFK